MYIYIFISIYFYIYIPHGFSPPCICGCTTQSFDICSLNCATQLFFKLCFTSIQSFGKRPLLVSQRGGGGLEVLVVYSSFGFRKRNLFAM